MRAKFLEALEKTGGNVWRSCKLVRLGHSCAYEWRSADEDFRRAWDAAVDRGTDLLESEAQRRAVDGVLKPVYQGGVKVGDVREYSDRLMEMMLRSRRPDKFSSRVDNRVSGTLTLEQLVGRASGAEK